MGRDGVLPRRAFGRLNEKSTPAFNILLIGAITVSGSLTMSYEHAAEVLNFGAFIAFMGVNAAVVKTFYRKGRQRSVLLDLAAPVGGLLFCTAIWGSLPILAKVIGFAWLLLGVAYLAVLTHGFRRAAAQLEFAESSGGGTRNGLSTE
jgi:amino acid transporter